jgi:hypothetical protein
MPTKKNIGKLTAERGEKTVKTLTAKIQADQRRLKRAIEKLEARLIREFNQLKSSGSGALMGPRTNLTQAMKIRKDMIRIWEDDYGSIVRTNVKNFNVLEKLISENYAQLEVPKAASFTGIDRTMINQLQKQVMADFTTIGNAAQDRISRALFDMIATQSPMEDLVKSIRGALTGLEDVRGKPLADYAEMYANDGVMNFYNAVHVEKGNSAGLTSLLYVGSVMKNTRSFCLERVGQVYTIDEINSWDHEWSGKRGPALIYRGGWNCRHTWQPVEEEWVDQLEEWYGPPANKDKIVD